MRYDRGYVDFTRPPPPVKEGDVLSVKIEGLGSSGDGLARVKGFVIFVPGTKMEEECTVRVTKVSRKVGFAEKVDESEVDEGEVDEGEADEGEADEGEAEATEGADPEAEDKEDAE
jgi:predicted RNA-binding protein with TRAM domain